MSNYYFNCKSVTLHPEGMYLIGNIVFETIKGLNVKGIGGLTLGADTISNAVGYTSYLKENPIEVGTVHGPLQVPDGKVHKDL